MSTYGTGTYGGGTYADLDGTATEPQGGNLTKPRLHLGNAPGRKQRTGHGTFAYRLSLIGAGVVDGARRVEPSTPVGAGVLCAEHAQRLTHRLSATGTACSHARLDVIPARAGAGVASEDLYELIVLNLV